MKVLLLGEFSGFYKNLKEGLQENGIEVTLVANGDGWKKIKGADDELYRIRENRNYLYKFIDYIVEPLRDKRFEGYDVVQIVNPGIFFWGIGPEPFKRIIRNNGPMFVNCAGLDTYLYNAWKNHKFDIDYYALDSKPPMSKNFDNRSLKSFAINITNRYVIEHAKAIIPVVPYEYEIPYQGKDNLEKTILLPINTDSIIYRENAILNGKIVFFHGISRPEEKGTAFINEAMTKLREKYPNDVECIITKRMGYSEYVDTMQHVNVLIDQCKSYAYGINACVGMAMGKIVFSGFEDQVKRRMDCGKECPVINIIPSADQIYREMEKIIENRSKIGEMGLQAREFVEAYHNHIKIAKQYIDVWKKY